MSDSSKRYQSSKWKLPTTAEEHVAFQQHIAKVLHDRQVMQEQREKYNLPIVTHPLTEQEIQERCKFEEEFSNSRIQSWRRAKREEAEQWSRLTDEEQEIELLRRSRPARLAQREKVKEYCARQRVDELNEGFVYTAEPLASDRGIRINVISELHPCTSKPILTERKFMARPSESVVRGKRVLKQPLDRKVTFLKTAQHSVPKDGYMYGEHDYEEDKEIRTIEKQIEKLKIPEIRVTAAKDVAVNSVDLMWQNSRLGAIKRVRSLPPIPKHFF